MSSLALSFNNVTLNPVPQNDGQIWITSAELAKALGYSEVDSVTKIFNRHKDEFTDRMTLTVKMTVKGFGNGNSEKEVRIFSLRGCHLIAMLAKTAVAKLFRIWVLDILDKEIALLEPKRITLTVEQQKALADTVRSRCKTNGEHYQTVWHNLKQHFGVERYTDILSADFPKAIQFVKTVELPPMIENQPQQHLLPKETVSKAIDYISAISRLVVELGGTLPKIDLDSDQLAIAYAQRLLMGRRMTVSFDEAGQPNLRLIPQQSWIVTNENIANIVSDPCGIDKALLPNIIVSATNRLYPTK